MTALPLSPPLDRESQSLIFTVACTTQALLDQNYFPGFGIFPTADRSGSFYNQVWTRDAAHAASNYFAFTDPAALRDTLATILRHQQPDTYMLPLKVERTYAVLRSLPGRLKYLSDFLFHFKRGDKERPVYEGQDWSGGEDTVPDVIVAVGEYFVNSQSGVDFARDHYSQLKNALAFFQTKTAPDHLAVITHDNADWADSIKRRQKLGNINVMWAQSLKMMALMARRLGYPADASAYTRQYRQVTASVMAKLYHPDAYFRARAGEDRIDTVASIWGALYLLSPTQAAQVEDTLDQKVRRPSGLQNFYPPYPLTEIQFFPYILDWGRYHNYYVWPWVTCQNIQVQIKIALTHPDPVVRQKFRTKAVADFLSETRQIAAIGAQEIVLPDRPLPADTFRYRSQRNFMATLAAYQGAHRQLAALGWIPK